MTTNLKKNEFPKWIAACMPVPFAMMAVLFIFLTPEITFLPIFFGMFSGAALIMGICMVKLSATTMKKQQQTLQQALPGRSGALAPDFPRHTAGNGSAGGENYWRDQTGSTPGGQGLKNDEEIRVAVASRFCKYCGSEISPDEKICEECGMEVDSR